MNSLLQVRKRLSLTQRDLSVALGVGQSAISQYECGACDPSIEVSRKLIEVARNRGVSITLDEIYADPSCSSEEQLAP
ncbi:helix-turn-helix transcriptional regulator [Burkholderia gladioli]|nr:helix-turn-helix transcriptional regulator [Burkholderia gladioli]